MKDISALIPKLLHPAIEGSRYYAVNSRSIVIQSDESRKRNDNVQGCHKKLYDFIVNAGKSIIRGETSPEQAERVRGLYVFCAAFKHATLTPSLIGNAKTMRCGYVPKSLTATRRLPAKALRGDRVIDLNG